MKIVLLCFFFSFAVSAKTAQAVYGKKITLKNPLTLKQATSVKNTDKQVLVKAKVGKVCKKKGCWMILESKEKEIRVTFKDYSFFVPMGLIGKDVLIQGQMIEKKMSLEETKHFVADEGGDTSKITKGRSEFRILASGVQTI
jgi:hypothetical protein